MPFLILSALDFIKYSKFSVRPVIHGGFDVSSFCLRLDVVKCARPSQQMKRAFGRHGSFADSRVVGRKKLGIVRAHKPFRFSKR